MLGSGALSDHPMLTPLYYLKRQYQPRHNLSIPLCCSSTIALDQPIGRVEGWIIDVLHP